MLTKEYILEQLEKYCDLDWLSAGNYEDKIIYPLQRAGVFDKYDWTYDAGISKCVLIFDNLDYVIKIPFYAEWFEGEEIDYDEENDEPIYEDGYTADYPFEGIEVEGYVKENHWDYCETESLLYKAAEKNGVAEYFAETIHIGYAKDWPIYAQTRACMFCSEDSRTTRSRKNYTDEEKETVKTIRSTTNFYLDDEWLMDFIAFWGQARLMQLIQFCNEYFIDDLHNGNIGYVCGAPCLIDYSSYDC